MKIIRRKRAKGCSGKVRFGTKKNAYEVMKSDEKYKGCTVYRCPVCGGWHFGHK